MNNLGKSEKLKKIFWTGVKDAAPHLILGEKTLEEEKQLIYYLVPLLDEDGKNYGTVSYSLNANYIENLFQQNLPEKEGYFMLMKAKEHVMASQKQDEVTAAFLAQNPLKKENNQKSFQYHNHRFRM